MSKLIRFCKLTEDRVGDNVFDVSRAGILGNPYTHIKDKNTKALIKVKTKDIAINMYEKYFREMMNSKDPGAKPFQREFMKIVDAYKKYPEVYIGCYCHTNETCHGDFIIKQVMKYTVIDTLLKKNSQLNP